MKILTFSTLFPNSAKPGHGIFVETRLRHLVAERLDRLPPGAVLVVRAQAGAGSAGYQEMVLDFEKALEGAMKPKERR